LSQNEDSVLAKVHEIYSDRVAEQDRMQINGDSRQNDNHDSRYFERQGITAIAQLAGALRIPTKLHQPLRSRNAREVDATRETVF
jgi:hypothetical protein